MSTEEAMLEKLEDIDASIARINETLKEYLHMIACSLEKIQVIP